MSDFLIALGDEFSGAALLEMLRLPYGHQFRDGQSFDFKWGCAAILSEPAPAAENVRKTATGLMAVVGDCLVRESERLAEGLLACADKIREGKVDPWRQVQSDSSFGGLNGAFAILLADNDGASMITDPLGSVQVYAGRNGQGSLTAIGTHQDLVASVAGEPYEIDPVAVFEFLNAGTPCFPHTMHARVLELGPGRLHVVVAGENRRPGIKDVEWWPFPRELEGESDEAGLAAQLREAFVAAVRDRCGNGTVGVTLSGGMDSRLVMAAVPSARRCVGFTFCDVINREAQIARRIARCYHREWVPLFRDAEYIARTALNTVKFIGCEGDWVNAHGLGFVDEIAQHRPGVVLSGLLMNNNVKGFYAADVARVPRWRGLLPPKYEVIPYDYVGELKPFATGVFQAGLFECARSRRKSFLEGHPGLKRQSVAEWLDGYPFSQAPDNTAWVAERRLMPVRLPAMDRRVLEVACRIPMSTKAGGRLFVRMAKSVLGPGAGIPDANDGVRPGSNHVWRLMQRAIREAANKRRTAFRRLGVAQPVPTSWHDYQSYWRESGLLRQLLSQHGENLRDFEGSVFSVEPKKLYADAALPWLNGFRLVQLALWKSILREYQTAARQAKDNSKSNALSVLVPAK